MMQLIIMCRECYNEFTVPATAKLGTHPMCPKCARVLHKSGETVGAGLGTRVKRAVESLTAFRKKQ